MPLSWFCPATPDRKASDWNTLRVLSLKVVTAERESEYEAPKRATPLLWKKWRSGSDAVKVSPVVVVL